MCVQKHTLKYFSVLVSRLLLPLCPHLKPNIILKNHCPFFVFLIIAFPASFQNGSTNGSVPDWGRWVFFAYFWVRYSQMIPKWRKWRRENLKATEERWGKVGGKPLGEAINLQAKMG